MSDNSRAAEALRAHLNEKADAVRSLQQRVDALDIRQEDRLDAIFDQGVETFGSAAKLARWLTTPNRALGGRAPFDLVVADEDETERVREIIIRIDHGVIS